MFNHHPLSALFFRVLTPAIYRRHFAFIVPSSVIKSTTLLSNVGNVCVVSRVPETAEASRQMNISHLESRFPIASLAICRSSSGSILKIHRVEYRSWRFLTMPPYKWIIRRVGMAQHLTRREGQVEVHATGNPRGLWFVRPTVAEIPFYAVARRFEGSANILPARCGTKVLTEALRVRSFVRSCLMGKWLAIFHNESCLRTFVRL